MTNIKLDFNNVVGKIKPMHAVGQPPIWGVSTEHFHYLKEAHIPYSRLHDVGGWFGGNLFVDIPNIFRDFNADVSNPDSYDFTFTDILIKGLIENGVEPYFRLGITIENYFYIKSYRAYPPKDFQKWAEICEHIVRHYNEGWANGYFFDIKYWEIWNEPEGHPDRVRLPMWRGTPEQYYDLYRVTSKHLRKCFGNRIKIGAYGMWGMYKGCDNEDVRDNEDWQNRIAWLMDFFNGFIKMVKDESLPFDFFSHHSYWNVKQTVEMEKYCEKLLEDAGLGYVEKHLNEWNTHPGCFRIGTSLVCANATAMLLAMQNTKMDMMCYYDARMSASDYGGMFNAYTQKPFCLYYGFKAFGELYTMGMQVSAESNNGDIYVVAAKDGYRSGILISNIGKEDSVSINISEYKKAYLIDQAHEYTETEISPECFTLSENQVIYIEL